LFYEQQLRNGIVVAFISVKLVSNLKKGY
jgi:hypothetical protein